MSDTPKYQPQSFESKWRSKWEKDHVYQTPDINDNDKKHYVLDMFPYPSGAGLHVGHVEGYTATDIYSRYMRMRGYKVMHPMGFDSFGLPAENYAVKTGTHPKITTEKAIETFTEQMKAIGLSYDWDLMLAAHDPNYYKWTQWLFLLMYKRGLAYRKKQAVNWCSGCQTVLANEQVVDGKCERCDSVVVQKEMEQWFLKITDYSERLLADLDKLDWPESTKMGQRNWIGKSEGLNFTMKVKGHNKSYKVYDSVPQTYTAQTFAVIAPEHKDLPSLVKGTANEKTVIDFIESVKKQKMLGGKYKVMQEIEGVDTGLYMDNPYGTGDLPLWVATFAIVDYGDGVVGCSAHDERDFRFAKKYNIPLRPVMFPEDPQEAEKVRKLEYCFHHEDNGLLEQPKEFVGRKWGEVRKDIIEFLVKKGLAEKTVQFKLRDWLISRQRFWGAPIPMRKKIVDSCPFDFAQGKQGAGDPPSPMATDGRGREQGTVYSPVSESELPVVLPMDAKFAPTGKSPLADHPDFQDREVDTMDTFVDSSWYFLRFAQLTSKTVREASASGKEKSPFDEASVKEVMNKWCPVDLYVGGAEHTVLHLLYARFFTKVLFDAGYVSFDEPFLKLRHQGIIMGPDHRKMSKRWGNVINPLEVVSQYGADTLRMYEMFMGPLDQMKAWQVEGVAGTYRFLARVWKSSHVAIVADSDKTDKNVEIALHKTIKKLTEDIPELKFNTAIASCMEFLNTWEKEGAEKISKNDLKSFVKIIAPFAPHITEELWSGLGEGASVHLEFWPSFDESLLISENVTIPVQVNGKVRGTIELSKDADNSNDEILTLAKAQENIAKYITSTPKKVIYVKGKIVNVIV